MNTHPLHLIRNQRGLAMLETVPLLVIFVVLMSFGLGFFGIVHTATLHSIASRTYAFETFRQRTNLYFFREDGSGESAGDSHNYSKKGWRFHSVQNENDSRNEWVPSTRPIALGRSIASSETSLQDHNEGIYQLLPRNDRIAVNPVWVMVGYGICLNANCGNQ